MSCGDGIIFARDLKAKTVIHRCRAPRLLRMSPVDAGQQITKAAWSTAPVIRARARSQTQSRSPRYWPTRSAQVPPRPIAPLPPIRSPRLHHARLETIVAIEAVTFARCRIAAPSPAPGGALGPAPTPTRVHHFESIDLWTVRMTVHKDSSPHRAAPDRRP
jgi:hypothetical protein